jgi:hypothetical protein
MTTLEIQASATAVFLAPALSPVPSQDVITGTMVDCPAYAWDNSDQPAILDLRERYGIQWVSDWRDDLDTAAYDLIRDYLLAEWRKRGYEPEFTDDTAKFEADSHHPAPTDPSDQTYWAVWEAAAYAITADELIDKANLREYAR